MDRGNWQKPEYQDIRNRKVVCTILRIQTPPLPPAAHIKIALSLIRPNRLDWAVEKLTELGVGAIYLFRSRYTGLQNAKIPHLRKIAIAAIKQSRQTYLPEIYEPLEYESFIQKVIQNETGKFYIAHPGPQAHYIREHPPRSDQSIWVTIGPEGGFTAEEIQLALNNGFKKIILDNHILRTETAAIIAMAQAKWVHQIE